MYLRRVLQRVVFRTQSQHHPSIIPPCHALLGQLSHASPFVFVQQRSASSSTPSKKAATSSASTSSKKAAATSSTSTNQKKEATSSTSTSSKKAAATSSTSTNQKKEAATSTSTSSKKEAASSTSTNPKKEAASSTSTKTSGDTGKGDSPDGENLYQEATRDLGWMIGTFVASIAIGAAFMQYKFGLFTKQWKKKQGTSGKVELPSCAGLATKILNLSSKQRDRLLVKQRELEQQVNIAALSDGKIINPETPGLLMQLGEIYLQLGHAAMAQKCGEDARRIWHDIAGNNEPSKESAQAMLLLAKSLAAQQKASAEPSQCVQTPIQILEDTLRDLQACTPEENHDTDLGIAAVRYELSRALARNGLVEDAVAFAVKSLSTRQSSLGPLHPDVASSLHLIGRLNLGRRDHKQVAVEQLLKALSIRRANLDAAEDSAVVDVGQFASNIHDVGIVLLSTIENKAVAADHLECALDLRRFTHSASAGVNGREPSKTFFQSLFGSAVAQHAIGEKGVAQERLREHIGLMKRWHPEDKLRIAESLNFLGAVESEAGKPEDAEKTFREVVDLCRSYLVADHPAMATSLANLGTTCLTLEKYAEAIQCFSDSIEVHKKRLPCEHFVIADGILRLSGAFLASGDANAARTTLTNHINDLAKANKQNSPSGESLRDELVQLDAQMPLMKKGRAR